MAKGQHLSKYQQGVVRRYYEHKDAAAAQKLQEIVSDLYLAEPKQAEKLWKRAEAALAQAGVEPARVQQATAGRRVETLAALVNDLTKPR